MWEDGDDDGDGLDLVFVFFLFFFVCSLPLWKLCGSLAYPSSFGLQAPPDSDDRKWYSFQTFSVHDDKITERQNFPNLVEKLV